MKINFLALFDVLFRILGKLEFLVPFCLAFVFCSVSLGINRAKRRLYFEYRGSYIDYLNAYEIKNEGFRRYVKVD